MSRIELPLRSAKILAAVEDGIGWLTLNNPARPNAVSLDRWEAVAQAAEVAARFRPDVAFLDLGMPGMSGHEVARALRGGATDSAIVLVAVTGWGQPEVRRRTREAGFDHHLVKPVDTELIEGLLSSLGDPGTR